MRRDPTTAAREFLSVENRRAMRSNLERLYPVDNAPAFEDFVSRIDEALRTSKPRQG